MTNTKPIPVEFKTAADLTPMELVSQSIIANQFALNCNEAIQRTPFYKHALKPRLKSVIGILIDSEKQYDKIFDSQEKACVETYDALEQMMMEISSLGLHHFENITEMIQAFKRDPESICGIVNKINRGR